MTRVSLQAENAILPTP